MVVAPLPPVQAAAAPVTVDVAPLAPPPHPLTQFIDVNHRVSATPAPPVPHTDPLPVVPVAHIVPAPHATVPFIIPDARAVPAVPAVPAVDKLAFPPFPPLFQFLEIVPLFVSVHFTKIL